MELEADWPEGPHKAQLDALDDLARCPICHDFFHVPLTLGCGHAFCSGCVRSNLEFQERTGQAKCPACREKCDSRDLRHNHALKDLVKGYLQTRSLLVAAASQLQAPSPDVAKAPERAGNERKRPPQEQSEPASKRMALPTANSNSARRAQSADASSPPARRLLRPREGPGMGVRSSQKQNDKAAEEDIRVSLSSDTSWSSGAPSMSNGRVKDTAKSKAAPSVPSKPPPGYVMCPSCTAQIRGSLLNDHLDKCLDKAENEPRSKAPPKPVAPVAAPALAAKPKKAGCKLEVPPKLVFSMLKDRELTSKLKAVRLPTEGKRQDLEQRYNKLRVEVQMAQDAEEPVMLDEVVRRVMRKEKQASATFAGTRASNNASKSAPPIPGASSFEELIARSRERDASRKATSQPQKEQERQRTRDHDSSEALTEQHGSQARAPETVQHGRGPQHASSSPEPAGKLLAVSQSMHCCNGYSQQQGNAAGHQAELARCTVYAKEPGDKHAMQCSQGMPSQNGFIAPLTLQDAVPDSASE